MRVLVVEDDKNLREQLSGALADAGYTVDTADNGEDGQFLGETEPYDLAILDLGLPKVDGLSVLKAWRKEGRSMPVLILSARDRWSEKVEGLDLGANDYVTKPFHMAELLARVRANVRRQTEHQSSVLEVGDLSLNSATGQVTVNGVPVKLTAYQYKVLDYLMHHAGRIVSRAELTEKIYSQDHERDSNTIEVFIGILRRKIGSDRIITEKGLGYRLVDPADQQ
ncbi:MAG TPA: response regulator transcription factor [Vitreimonas sp.]|uniref:response regulator transcription factor n=1 Tax=Vitreimonas sp. TaxID=3069702 RepID=UPI002D2C2EFC|nr:response regulator transcription factor [Vitreimonas sp.]HYD89191.1 response regulator transcription factor [Vitreimonas sp.]